MIEIELNKMIVRVGIQFAEPALLLSMASILHAFKISPVSQKTPEVEFTTGITRCVFAISDVIHEISFGGASHIKPFAIRLEPRGPL
jgi:hypothetical protein